MRGLARRHSGTSSISPLRVTSLPRKPERLRTEAEEARAGGIVANEATRPCSESRPSQSHPLTSGYGRRRGVRSVSPPQMQGRIITPTAFLATKLEAFKGRGHNDFFGRRWMI